MSDKSSLVDRINAEVEELRTMIRERLGEDDDSRPEGLPQLPKLDTKDEDSTFEQWYDDNVQPLVDAMQEYKDELSQREERHTKLSAKLEVVTDLLPSRDK